MITLKSNFVGILAIALILTGMNLPWITAGYAIDGVITPSTSTQTEIRYKESLTYNVNLFGYGDAIYYTLYQDKEIVVKYSVKSDINKYSWMIYLGAIIILIGSITGYATLFLGLTVTYIEAVQPILYLIGAIAILGGIIIVNQNFDKLTLIIDRDGRIEQKTVGEIRSETGHYLKNLPQTFIGVENFCSFGFGTFVTFIGFLIAFAYGVWIILKLVLFGKKEEFYIE